jgi:hypothetical protein
VYHLEFKFLYLDVRIGARNRQKTLTRLRGTERNDETWMKQDQINSISACNRLEDSLAMARQAGCAHGRPSPVFVYFEL